MHTTVAEQPRAYVVRAPSPAAAQGHDPRWYQRAIFYQLHVRGFYDSNADGVGDFPGLIQKLDYLQDLGTTALWLLPFYPSPLRDGGYDIADFRAIHPQYGNWRDFKSLLSQAHRRDLRVVIELVLNHTAREHPWFQRARRAPAGSSWRNFYVWSDTPQKYADARVIFRDDSAPNWREPSSNGTPAGNNTAHKAEAAFASETSNWTWDAVAGAYYFHRFYDHEPDLNYDHPEVQRAMLQVVDHWLATGVDGLALNTIAYLFEREGTNCENLPQNHQFLKSLRQHVDANFAGRVLLAEVNQWPEDAAAYFGQGDECQAALHFPLMPRVYMAVQLEDRRPLVDIIEQTPAGPEGTQWILFLRNQDELTLQMVTEQERAAMYRHYARDPRLRVHMGIRRRLAPLLENNRPQIELLNGLLFSLPGTPAMYYGDEIGMGDNVFLGDRGGVRTPMQWSPDRNAGFSTASPQQLYLPLITDSQYHYEAVNVQTQSQNPHSLLSWTRRLVACRKRSKALSEGSLQLVDPRNSKILAFVRQQADETVLVVANLSRFAQVAQLDLAAYRGCQPVELFGHVAFPPVGEWPYMLTLTPHAFFWLRLCSQQELAGDGDGEIGHSLKAGPSLAVIELQGDWPTLFEQPARQALEELLPSFLMSRRWFSGKAKTIRSVEIADIIPMPYPGQSAAVYWLLVSVGYVDAPEERYLVPLSVAGEDQLRWKDTLTSEAVVARLRFQQQATRQELLLYDVFGEEALAEMLLSVVAGRKSFAGSVGRLKGWTTRAFSRLRGPEDEALPSRALAAHTSNSAILYGERLLLKLFRRIDEGVNPDLEIGAFLTEAVGFAHIPPIAAALTYVVEGEEPKTLGIMSGFVPNRGNAWEYTLEQLEIYFAAAMDAGSLPPALAQAATLPLVELARRPLPEAAYERIGEFLQSAELLGRRTAEMHLALASGLANPNFEPEPFSQLYQRSLYQGLRNQAHAALELLERRLDALPAEHRLNGELALRGGKELIDRFGALIQDKINATRIRCHGDYHLGQVLYTGHDFVIIDFEGEPTRPISERQLKASPLRDVAGMLRSLDYACHAARTEQLSQVVHSAARREQLDQLVQSWVACTSAAYLRSYLAVAQGASFLPRQESHVQVLLDAYLAEKALYELQYELNNRPDWAYIPLKGILNLLERPWPPPRP